MTIVQYEEAIKLIHSATAVLQQVSEDMSPKELGDAASRAIDFLHPVATGNIKV